MMLQERSSEARPVASLVGAAAASGQAVGGNGNGYATLLLDEPVKAPYSINEAGDDREDIEPGDRVLLIVENDITFARFLLDTARARGMKGLVTSLGASALSLARQYQPQAITLDIHLPDIEGWRVLERLKNELAIRHVPVCVMSTDESRDRAFAAGALAFVAKPISSRDIIDRLLDYVDEYAARHVRHVLIIEPDEQRRADLVNSLESEDLHVTALAEARQAGAPAGVWPIDCVVSGEAGTDSVDALAAGMAEEGHQREFARLPVLVLTGGSSDHGSGLRVTDCCVLRRVHSQDRLLDYVALFTHVNVGALPHEQRQAIYELRQSDSVLADKKVLIVDDDMRNIFALSTVLEEHEMVIVAADNGRDAIKILQAQPDIDIVLMDIMMPEMDGMETMREIRKLPELKDLPIVAVTAKAMKGDREKCIEAGAWDYLSKPVETEQVLAVLRAWLHQ
jgi:CheY-like chemotaxis protein